jgi:DNA-directed RNA polymerase specialized sigma24 family protein
MAKRRDVRRETGGTRERSGNGESMFPQWMLEHVDNAQPSHEEKVIVLEELDRLLQGLPEELRQIVLWKLDGFTNAEIACSIGRTVRCVELKMQLIRKRLELKADQLEALAAADE